MKSYKTRARFFKLYLEPVLKEKGKKYQFDQKSLCINLEISGNAFHECVETAMCREQEENLPEGFQVISFQDFLKAEQGKKEYIGSYLILKKDSEKIKKYLVSA